MKKLILLRHAKSSWSNDNLPDFDRPLNQRGQLSCDFMKHRLWAHLSSNFQVVSSSSQRTTETAQLFFKDFPKEIPEVSFLQELYHASPKTILYTIQNQKDAIDTLVVIGHNPGISELSYLLCGEPRNMVTANFSVIKFEIDSWSLVFDNSGSLVDFDYPKKHQQFIKILDEQ